MWISFSVPPYTRVYKKKCFNYFCRIVHIGTSHYLSQWEVGGGGGGQDFGGIIGFLG